MHGAFHVDFNCGEDFVAIMIVNFPDTVTNCALNIIDEQGGSYMNLFEYS